jgi:hypothetical protein
MHALGAHLDYQSVVSLVKNFETRQSRLVWFHLSSFLHHAAMISKFVAPICKNEVALARGKKLREALGVHPESEVIPRDARDNIEHFDERMDKWVEDKNPTVLEIVVSHREGYDFLRVADKRVKRLLIANELVFVSERRDSSKFELYLSPVYEEIERIRKAAEGWMGDSSPYEFLHPRLGKEGQ